MTMADLVERTKAHIQNKATQFRQWLDTNQGRGVLKCTIAYTIASLATFVPFISNFLGKPEGKHVVATITVYFHPARSAGSMIEAIFIAIFAVAYAEIVSLLSMATSVFFGSNMHLVAISHVLVVVVFIGGGFGLMGWVKQKMSNPLVNVGSTLASLAIISVVTRENHVISNVFSNEKLSQVFKMLIMGITTTAAVNLLLWRQSARQSLRQSMSQSSACLADLITMITDVFLTGSDAELVSEKFKLASSSYSQEYGRMMKDLREAKFEHFFLGNEIIYNHEESVTRSMETLSQALGGLRNAVNTQLELLQNPNVQTETGADETVRGPSSELFELFNDSMALSMSSLRDSIHRCLHEPPFEGLDINIDEDLRRNLMDSLSTFNAARADTLQTLYGRSEPLASRSDAARANMEEIVAACGHFSFGLQSFGEEVLKYLDVLDDLEYEVSHKRQSWTWLVFWRRGNHQQDITLLEPEANDIMSSRHRLPSPPGSPRTLADPVAAPASHTAPGASRVLAWVWRTTSAFLKKMARDDIQFGLKVGIGAALWAMLAFIEETRDLYSQWRGEWGLLSFMIVCSMTVGASNTTGLARFIGTLFGAMFSIVNWKVSGGYALALIVLGGLTSFINFYIIVARGKAALGRITLLAYNVSTLYAYSLQRRAKDDDSADQETRLEIVEIAKHRTIAVTAGILWGLVVCRVIWPISARRKFKESLSLLHLQLGLIWKRGPLAVLFRSEGSQSYLKSTEQVALQRFAASLEDLRQSAASEFEMRGPFPMDVYGRVLRGTTRILDGFYSMSLVAYRKGHLTEGEKALLQYTARERAALCDHICQAFQVVASSTMLEYPLTDATPSIIVARENLLSKIYEFRQEHPSDQNHSSTSQDVFVEEKDYALLYAYALVTGQVANELRMVGREIGSLFGVLNENSRLLP